MFIFSAILSYFFTALATVSDKFLISSRRVGHPASYAFFLGILSILTLAIFFPFGLHLVAVGDALLMFLFGALYIFGSTALFFAIQKNEASRVIPVVGAATSIFSFFISLIFLGSVFGLVDIIGVVLLVFGGLLISLKLNRKEARKIFSGFSLAVLAGLFLAVAFSGFKFFYEKDAFFNVFMWTRVGLFLGALSLLLVPRWRKNILGSFGSFNKERKKSLKTGGFLLMSKIFGGIGSIIFNFSISLGDVAFANALIATEYVFVFVIGALLSLKFPRIFHENNDFFEILQKIIAIFIIGAGVWLVK